MFNRLFTQKLGLLGVADTVCSPFSNDVILNQLMESSNTKQMPDSMKKLHDITMKLNERDLDIQKQSEIITKENDILCSIARSDSFDLILQKIQDFIVEYDTSSVVLITLFKKNKLVLFKSTPNTDQSIINIFQDGIATDDLSKTCVHLEDHILKSYNIKKNKIIPRSIDSIFHSYPIQNLYSPKSNHGYIFIINPNITKLPFEYFKIIDWCSSTIATVVERYNLQEKIKEKTSTLEKIIDALSDYLFVLTKDGYCDEMFSKADNTLLIHKNQNIIGKHFLDVICLEKTECDLTNIREVLNKCETTNQQQTFEQMSMINGKPKWLQIRISKFNQEQYLAAIHDITEKQNLLEDLKVRNNILETIVYDSNNFVWYVDQDNKYVYADDKFKKCFYNTEDNIIGLTVDQVYDIYLKPCEVDEYSDFKNFGRTTTKFVKEKKKKSSFFGFIKFNDRHIVLETIKTPIYDVEGNFKGIIGVSWDRTPHSDKIQKDIGKLLESEQLQMINDVTYYIYKHNDICSLDSIFC